MFTFNWNLYYSIKMYYFQNKYKIIYYSKVRDLYLYTYLKTHYCIIYFEEINTSIQYGYIKFKSKAVLSHD